MDEQQGWIPGYILIQPMRWDEPDPGMAARVTRKR
jgi:hypothetical protein